MPIVQGSYSGDLRALAIQAFTNGGALSSLVAGTLRVEREPGPWCVRAALSYKDPYGPAPFTTLPVPGVVLRVQEGSDRGQSAYRNFVENVRDSAHNIYADSASIDIVVPAYSTTEACTVNVWIARGPAPRSALPSQLVITDTLANWRTQLATLLQTVDTSIPAWCDTIEVPAPTNVRGNVIPYPLEVHQMDPAGADLGFTTIAAADKIPARIPLDVRARFVVVINAAAVLGVYPCTYLRY